MLCAGCKRVASGITKILGDSGELFQKLVVNSLLDEDARTRGAALAHVKTEIC
jgi:hypothetical protein